MVRAIGWILAEGHPGLTELWLCKDTWHDDLLTAICSMATRLGRSEDAVWGDVRQGAACTKLLVKAYLRQCRQSRQSVKPQREQQLRFYQLACAHGCIFGRLSRFPDAAPSVGTSLPPTRLAPPICTKSTAKKHALHVFLADLHVKCAALSSGPLDDCGSTSNNAADV